MGLYTNVGGVGGSVAPVRDTWANILANYNPTTCEGKRFIVTDFGSPLDFVSNGVEFVPVNGQCTLSVSGTGYGIMPSGTIATGASGHFTSGTALPHTYSSGLWMYIVSAGTTPALTAGFYWCVFSNTTTCTIYTNGPGSAAYNFTVGAATTGSTSEITARSATIPAGLMGEAGQLVCDSLTSLSATATTRSLRTRLGGSQTCAMSTAGGTTTSYSGRATTQNVTESLQYSNPVFTGSTSTYTLARTTIDTTAETTYTLTLQMGTATDFMINHSFRLDLYK